MSISALFRLWHRVRAIQKEGYDFLEHLLSHIHRTVNPVAGLGPIHLARPDFAGLGRSAIAELDVEQTPAQDHGDAMIRIAMPRGRLPWIEALSPTR
jgi:hypothetical protein